MANTTMANITARFWWQTNNFTFEVKCAVVRVQARQYSSVGRASAPSWSQGKQPKQATCHMFD